MDYYDEIQEIVEMKLELMNHTSFSEEHIELLIKEAEVKILNYINCSRMPKQAYYTWANIVVDYVTYLEFVKEKLSTGDGYAITPNVSGGTKSIKDGDSTVEFFQSTGTSLIGGRRSLSWDDLLFDHKHDLMEFRNMIPHNHFGKRL